MRKEIERSEWKLRVDYFDDATVLPYKNKKNLWGIGGLVDRNNNYIDSSGFESYWVSFGGYYSYGNGNVNYIDESVIWFGIFTEHWGHYLVDNISRMWFLLDNYNGEKIAYVSKSGNSMDGNFLRFMELLGVDKRDIICITSPTRFKKVIVPEYAKNDKYYNDEYIRIFDKVIKNSLVFDRVSKLKKEKVLLSRRMFGNAHAKELFGDYVENEFINSSYIPVSPESLSLDEQIYLWNKTRSIVCMNGTIPLNICFCRNENIEIIVLNKTSIKHDNLFDFQKIFKLERVKYLDAYDYRYASWAQSLGGGPFVLSVTKDIKEFLMMPSIQECLNRKGENKRLIYIFLLKGFVLSKVKGVLIKVKRKLCFF